MSLKQFVYFWFCYQNSVCIYLVQHMRHLPRPPYHLHSITDWHYEMRRVFQLQNVSSLTVSRNSDTLNNQLLIQKCLLGCVETHSSCLPEGSGPGGAASIGQGCTLLGWQITWYILLPVCFAELKVEKPRHKTWQITTKLHSFRTARSNYRTCLYIVSVQQDRITERVSTLSPCSKIILSNVSPHCLRVARSYYRKCLYTVSV